ncbi:MAG: amidohydrolase [Clostridia bacterium]|nr:amidohydrolase [Clostridia bacterium]
MEFSSDIKNRLFSAVEKNRKTVLEAERHIWNNPESGYREWKTHAYLKEKFEELGYSLYEAGNIPGFYTEFDTGVPGPTVVVFGEMDALIIPGHPDCDKTTGAVHACGHNVQCAALLGVAAALKEPGVTDGLCGKIRLFAVPAEEMIELEYRTGLIEKGIISYYGGKQEFMKRGFLDGVDLAFMVHQTSGSGASATASSNGCIVKTYEFIGKATHASDPRRANNALYAATNAINAVNALGETFDDAENIRFHPIITEGGQSVNTIPDRVKVETYIRGASMKAIGALNPAVNRAFAASAASMGCRLIIHDAPGYGPRHNDANLTGIMLDAAGEIVGRGNVKYSEKNALGCSDMGDVSQVIPCAHPFLGGTSGRVHTAEFRVSDPELAALGSAKLQLLSLFALLSDGASAAGRVIAESSCAFSSVGDYFRYIDSFIYNGDAVFYEPDGSVKLKFTR